jgi:hypothetical protein
MRTLTFLSCAALLLAGCSGDGDGDKDELEPRAQIRVYDTAEPTCVASLGTGQGERPVEVTVLFDECISYCTDSMESSCSIERDGRTLRVQAFAKTRLEWMPNRACPEACLELEATCQSVPIPLGDYTVVQGEFARTVTLPNEISEAASCCFDHPCADDE